MARQVTKKAFEEWIKDEANVEDVLNRVAGGETLRNAAMAVKRPYTCLHGYFHDGGDRQVRYDAARKAYSDAVMDEAIQIADGCKPDKDHVAKAKLRIEARQASAKAYHRERWGERLQIEKDVRVTADAGLLGFAGDLLLKAKRAPLTIENAPGQALDVSGSVGTATPAVALPAPAVAD